MGSAQGRPQQEQGPARGRREKWDVYSWAPFLSGGCGWVGCLPPQRAQLLPDSPLCTVTLPGSRTARPLSFGSGCIPIVARTPCTSPSFVGFPKSCTLFVKVPGIKTLLALTGVSQWVGHCPENRRVPVQFPVTAPAGGARGDLSVFLTNSDVSVPFFLPPFPSL